MAFFLFLLVNAALFLRPAELVAAWQGVSLYEYLIIACFLFAIPDLLTYLTGRSLETQPITLCVFGVLAAVVLSQLAMFNFGEAWRTGYFFLKVVVYYLLFVSVVNTPARLRTFIVCLVWLCAGLTLVTLLQYHDVISLPNLKTLIDTETDPVTGEIQPISRLTASGALGDPNELGVVLAAVVPLALYLLTDRKTTLAFLYAVPVGLFVYAIALTQSRGAFVALLAGLGALAAVRYGARRALVLAALALPVIVLFFAGRQTDLSTLRGTGQTRIQIWSDWLTEFRASPLFGHGMALEEDPAQISELAAWRDNRHVAHNSYLHSFRDLGLLGGMFFLGAFVLAFWMLLRLDPRRTRILRPDMERLRPALLGCLTAFAVGILALSLCYAVPTYVILGLTVSYGRVTPYYSVLPRLRWDLRVAGRLALASVSFLAFTYVTVRLFANFG